MILLRCVDTHEADMLIKEIDEGSFGTHANVHAMANKIFGAGYYWLLPSMRILMETKLDEAEWIQNNYDQLSLIDEKCMISLCHGQLYQQRLKRVLDKKVRPRYFKEGGSHAQEDISSTQGFTWEVDSQRPIRCKESIL